MSNPSPPFELTSPNIKLPFQVLEAVKQKFAHDEEITKALKDIDPKTKEGVELLVYFCHQHIADLADLFTDSGGSISNDPEYLYSLQLGGCESPLENFIHRAEAQEGFEKYSLKLQGGENEDKENYLYTTLGYEETQSLNNRYDQLKNVSDQTILNIILDGEILKPLSNDDAKAFVQSLISLPCKKIIGDIIKLYILINIKEDNLGKGLKKLIDEMNTLDKNHVENFMERFSHLDDGNIELYDTIVSEKNGTNLSIREQIGDDDINSQINNFITIIGSSSNDNILNDIFNALANGTLPTIVNTMEEWKEILGEDFPTGLN